MKNLCALVLGIVLAAGAFAQADTNSVAVHKDARIDQLVRKQAEINELTTREARRNTSGFRIQVINTTDRSAAIQAKTKIYQLYPELKAYLLYQAPYFRLRVGNYTDRKDAENMQKKLSKNFKQDLYIVNDTIEVNPDKSAEQ